MLFMGNGSFWEIGLIARAAIEVVLVGAACRRSRVRFAERAAVIGLGCGRIDRPLRWAIARAAAEQAEATEATAIVRVIGAPPRITAGVIAAAPVAVPPVVVGIRGCHLALGHDV